jgi:hypothetical protein
VAQKSSISKNVFSELNKIQSVQKNIVSNKRSLEEYSNLGNSIVPVNMINMSKRSSNAADAYGYEIGRREIVSMFNKGATDN